MAFGAKFTKGTTIKFPEIVGYRISARFTPNSGFGGHFFITLLEQVAARTGLDPVTMSDQAEDFRGTLQMDDESRSYQFDMLDLLSVHPLVDRNKRLRVIEFRYDRTVTNNGITAKLNFKATNPLDRGNLMDDYHFAAGAATSDFAEAGAGDSAVTGKVGSEGARYELLGFSCRQAASESPVYRFHSFATAGHTWLRALLKETARGSRHQPSFTVYFTQTKDQLVVDQAHTSTICVDESYGLARDWPLPPLAELANAPSGYPRHRHADPTPLKLMEANGAVGDETVDTLTLVYKPLKKHNLPIR